MAAIEGHAFTWSRDNAAYTDWETQAGQVLDDVWATFEKRGIFHSLDRSAQKTDLVGGLSSCLPTRSEPPSYDLLPFYDDVVHDLPPEYSALPPLAQQKPIAYTVPTVREKSQSRAPSLFRDSMLDIKIDFENFTGIREHKKKKAAAPKKAAPPTPCLLYTSDAADEMD